MRLFYKNKAKLRWVHFILINSTQFSKWLSLALNLPKKYKKLYIKKSKLVKIEIVMMSPYSVLEVFCEAQRSHFVVISVKIKERIKIFSIPWSSFTLFKNNVKLDPILGQPKKNSYGSQNSRQKKYIA